MPDETNSEKHNVIVLKNQNYDMTCGVSVSAQYAETVKTYMEKQKAEGSGRLAVSFSSLS